MEDLSETINKEKENVKKDNSGGKNSMPETEAMLDGINTDLRK